MATDLGGAAQHPCRPCLSGPSNSSACFALDCAAGVRHDHRLHATQRASQPVRTSQMDLPPSYQFALASIEVAPGITITWTNHDNSTHSVRVEGPEQL